MRAPLAVPCELGLQVSVWCPSSVAVARGSRPFENRLSTSLRTSSRWGTLICGGV